jgi:predicted nuclease of predicted toxin-antitoxin system
VKLLLDENLSRRIVPFIQDSYPGSTQVALVGLERTDDRAIRQYALDYGYVIATHDADFYELNLLYGQPPKIIWLKTGNQSKATIIRALLDNQVAIEQALIVENKSCIEIYR